MLASFLPWLLAASLAGLGCSTERDPPNYSPIFGETIESDKATSHSQGEALSPDMEWAGYLPGSDELTSISLGDYHDPNGTKDVSALLITHIMITCGACQQTASDLPGLLTGGWTADGIEVIQLVLFGIDNDLATAEDAAHWKSSYNANWPVGFDPGFTFVQKGNNAMPIHVVIDPRTLEIVHRTEGYQSSFPALEDLAAANKE